MSARANASFTTTTGGASAVSRTVKSRPVRTAVPYAANHPGVTKLNATRLCESPIRLPPSTGVHIEPPACATLGASPAASTIR
jgi:hypothetical protein